jgi:hypothetical protein
MSRSAKVYILPAFHLAACLTPPLDTWFRVSPISSFIVIVWTLVMIADLPISLVAYFLAWHYSCFDKCGFLAGTAWWYFLSRKLLKIR